MGVEVLLLSKGAQHICTYCKKVEHRKYQCEDLKKKIEKKKKRTGYQFQKIKKKFFFTQEINTENVEDIGNIKYSTSDKCEKDRDENIGILSLGED
ncbi:hypothetical protein AYI70_g4905 [Smittium culicis]|uniref:CCHC-type domain-containing protein n=1 Tax=Smittium culicis TaxID=133412 RepID=A0A1R1XWV0_9FUNG|nr:hypothetical protein AYI70_g4905 [Smittium culicis]